MSEGYYGRPVLKQPVWKPEIGWYFFAGGTAGAAATLSLAARAARAPRLARTATLVAGAGAAASPALLVADLGRPERFLNMLRVFKPTSPMSVGSWIMTSFSTAQMTAAACELAGVMPRLRTASQAAAGTPGPAMATYTAVLISDTAVPVWHEARRDLPGVFAAGSAASAGAAAVLVGPAEGSGPARRLQAVGALAEEVALRRMTRRLGPLAEPYKTGASGRLATAGEAATLGGAALTLLGGRGRLGRLGAAVTLAGSIATRFAILRAGSASAADPRYVIESQRGHGEDTATEAGAPGEHSGPHPAASRPAMRRPAAEAEGPRSRGRRLRAS